MRQDARGVLRSISCPSCSRCQPVSLGGGKPCWKTLSSLSSNTLLRIRRTSGFPARKKRIVFITRFSLPEPTLGERSARMAVMPRPCGRCFRLHRLFADGSRYSKSPTSLRNRSRRRKLRAKVKRKLRAKVKRKLRAKVKRKLRAKVKRKLRAKVKRNRRAKVKRVERE